MICHKCNKDGEFYYHKGQICRPCKECKKARKKIYYPRERALNRKLQTSNKFREYRRQYRKKEAEEIRLQYIKKLLQRNERGYLSSELIELKKMQIKHLREIYG